MIVVEPVPVHATAVLTRGNFLPDDDAVVPALPAAHRRLPRGRSRRRRRRDDPAAVPRRPARRRRQLVPRELVAVGLAVDARRRRQPCDDRDRDRGDHRRVRPRRGARARQSGFDGIEVFAAYHALDRPVLDAVVEPAHRPLGRLARQPGALLGRRARRDPAGVRRRLHRRPGRQPRPGLRRVAVGGRAAGDRRLARRAGADGLRHVRDRQLLRLPLADADVAVPRAAGRGGRRRRSRRSSRNAVVQAESHIRTPAGAEAVLAAGHADMVSIVRGQIADPHLVAKARAGHPERVRPCISCNQLCWGRRSRDYWISCLVNPSVGREAEWGGDRFVPPPTPRPGARRRRRPRGSRGGPRERRARPPRRAGRGVGRARRAVASRRAAADAVAGARPPRLVRSASWNGSASRSVCGRRARGGDVVGGARRPRRRGRRCGAARSRLPACAAPRRPAAGNRARPRDDGAGRARRRGATSPAVCWCSTMSTTGGGSARRCSSRSAGARVTIATAAPAVAAGLYHSAADVPARRRFAVAGGELAPNTVVVGWGGDTATLRSTLTGSEVAATVRLARRRRDTGCPHRALGRDSTDEGIAYTAIGDCLAPRTAAAAILDGRRVGAADLIAEPCAVTPCGARRRGVVRPDRQATAVASTAAPDDRSDANQEQRIRPAG